MLAIPLDRSDQNAPNQTARFASHVRQLKEEYHEERKIYDARATFTVDSPIPYQLDALIDRLKGDNQEMVAGKGGQKQGAGTGD